MAILVAVLVPTYIYPYAAFTGRAALVLATVAMSVQLMSGTAGLSSLGQAAFLGVGGYTAVWLSRAGLDNGPLQLAAAAAAGAGAACLCAPLVLRARGVAFLMVTFAVGELAHTAASTWVPVTGGDNGLYGSYPTLWPTVPLPTSDLASYLYLLCCFLVLAGLVALVLRTRFALALRAAADHEPRLAALGHRVTGTLLAGYAMAGALAGAGGAMLFSSRISIAPSDMDFDTSALALLAAAIGGRSLVGAVIAAVGIVLVRDQLGVDTGGHAQALLGAAFLAVAYRRPVVAWVRARRSAWAVARGRR
ncbi:MAG: branched-chain amino acid ABC transporter permease [Micromonosporaceae bacterium]|nr:branched-chain amino acid ABC transporter permease [Micromonosporaceae bacterium]